MIDLHTHSSASDGSMAPKELVDYASEKGLSVLALTDHDTVLGLDDAANRAKEIGLNFVKGIELNIEQRKGEFHLLGLGLETVSGKLQEEIDKLQNGRIQRNFQIIEKMKADGFDVSIEEMKEMFCTESLGRPHFATYFIEKKIVKHRQQAFDKYLGKGRPYYVDRTGAVLSDAIEAIISSGGVPVIAHPLSLYVSWGKIESVLQEIREAGVLGLEAWHSGIRVVECQRLEEMAKRLGYFVTAGSDFHGESVRADRKIGHAAGQRKIEDRFWTEELAPALKIN